jgi:hypothetical protein
VKICNQCNESKHLDDFTVKEKLTGKLFNQCRLCRSIYSKILASRPEVKAVRREQKLQYWIEKKRELQPRRTTYMRKKRQDDPDFKIANVMRCTLSYLLTGKIKSTKKKIGCDANTLRKYISSQFVKGMSWGNYGEWEVDLKIPVSKFNQLDKVEFENCWHYSNLQPLWKSDNRLKSGSL